MKKAGLEQVKEPSGTRVRCPLCGNRFDEGEGPACVYCPRPFRSCDMVACPRCGHEFPRAGAERIRG
jgi:DNA-directed RNA polymerase subunit RPC12/RpoP